MIRRTSWLGCLMVLVCSAAVLAAPAEKTGDGKGKPDEDYELYKVLVDTIDQVERNYVKPVDRRELMEAAIRGVVAKLDPYSSYISPEEIDRFRAGVESEFGGIGIQISVDDGQLRIISPLVGSPGYRAGLLAGDRIVEINGKGTDGLTLDEAVARLKGPRDSTVTLVVIHPGHSRKETIAVKRELIHVETVLGDHRTPKDTWDFMLKPAERIGYIRISAFSRETAAELRRALEQLQHEKMRGLILDLRFNPGGLLSAAVDVSDLFISSGRIVSTQGRASPERIYNAHKEGTFEGFPMVVLVNHYSASASEIVAACLQDHQRAVILGERTWGKGSVQNVIELDSGHSALKLTTAAYKRPSGKNIHRFESAKDTDEWGVTPDKGFEVKLDDRETIALLEDRRRRDIVQPKPLPAEQTSTAKPAESDAARAAKPDRESDAGDAAPGDGAKPAAHAEKGSPAPTAFVDRQLAAAVKYLSDELARAK